MMTDVETQDRLYIDGDWTPASGPGFEVVSPVTEKPVAHLSAASAADVDFAVAAARRAFDNSGWADIDPGERIAAVRRLLAAYAERSRDMAGVISAEMGAPISFAKAAHVGLPMALTDALCNIAERVQWQSRRPGAFGGELLLRKEPVGVVAAVVPWNMPQFLIMTKVVPALLAGCTVVVKPAAETPLDALLLAEIIDGVGLPPGVVNLVPGDRDTGAALVAHPGVDKVSFTGSTVAGRQIAAACAHNLTPVTLELGGKSAAVVLDDADPAAVAAAVKLASLGNSGQICNALTRVLVPAGRQDEFTDALEAMMAAMVVGDPSDRATEVGPLVTRRQQERVLEYIADGVGSGATLVTGGEDMPDGVDSGWYVRPTLFADVDNDMRIAREEIFGPVLTVLPYADETEAIAEANDSEYGLAGSVFTDDVDRGLAVAARIRTGTFGINQGYSMDPAACFGGVKNSGYGRELGPEGIDAYLTTKSISGL